MRKIEKKSLLGHFILIFSHHSQKLCGLSKLCGEKGIPIVLSVNQGESPKNLGWRYPIINRAALRPISTAKFVPRSQG